jgi:prolyl oligopeptidase PreP (S9A serine peptidase family)
MARSRRLRRTALVAAWAGMLAGCAGVLVGHPTPVQGRGPLGVPEPTATQIAVGGAGANPTPSAPRMNPFVAQLRRRREPAAGNPYGWLQSVRSSQTRQWIRVESRATRKALADIPQRAWIASRLERLQAAGSRAPADVVVRHVLYLGPDGVRLPMEVAHRRGLTRDGDRPTLLAVYHSTGKPLEPLLQPFVLVWLQMGGVYARAQVRSGLARVPAARGAGRVPDRTVALSDLFAAAQSLIDDRYTRAARLGVYGRGFGGLMAGAAITQRPEFFAAALPTGTWAEYRAVRAGNCFPATLVSTAEHFGRIRPWRAYELTAALQAEQLCGHPILIRIDRAEGPRDSPAQVRALQADQLAFAARWLGARAP